MRLSIRALLGSAGSFALGIALAMAIGMACSTFEPGAESPVVNADASDDSCAFCNQDGTAEAATSSDPVEQISAGENFACGLRKSKTVVCWGDNSDGQVGQPQLGDLACDLGARCRAAPIQVPGLEGVTHVSAGHHFACARTADGAVKCWGENRGGQLGVGTSDPATRPTPAPVPNLPKALDVEAGYAAACARVEGDGGVEVYCWGLNRRGMLGKPIVAVGANPPTFAPDTLHGPTRIEGLAGAKRISLGPHVDTGCAIASDDTVRCWGRNAFGALGHTDGAAGDVICSDNGEWCNETPTTVLDASFKVKDLHLGFQTACGITLTGEVACWGSNGFGTLGRGINTSGDAAQHPAPVAVSFGGGAASQLSLRHAHACAIVAGIVRCWGDNPYGELGNGNSSDICNSTFVTDHPCRTTPQTNTNLANVVSIATGVAFTFAKTDDGRYWAWGKNGDARLGHPAGTSSDLNSCNNGFTRCNPTPQPLVFP